MYPLPLSWRRLSEIQLDMPARLEHTLLIFKIRKQIIIDFYYKSNVCLFGEKLKKLDNYRKYHHLRTPEITLTSNTVNIFLYTN